MKSASTTRPWTLRQATGRDVTAIEALIPLSVRGLQAAYYSPAQIEAALGPVFAVDRQLIQDGTYYVAEAGGELVGCGGWSRRRSLYGGEGSRDVEDALLDPIREAARIRAFFVHPRWALRGIGRSLLDACERAAGRAGFRVLDLVATLAGEPLYSRSGYTIVERYDIPLPGGLSLPVVRMSRKLPNAP